MAARTEGRSQTAVVGAGLAGLAAALRLAERGHSVTVFERQARVGGRAFTLREPLSPGMWADAGPSRFPDGFRRVREYADRFDLRLVPFYPDGGRFVALREGQPVEGYRPLPGELWGYTNSPSREGGRASQAYHLLRRVARRALLRPDQRTRTLHGGTESLIKAIARAGRGLGVDLRLSTRVEALRQGEWGVEVHWNREGRGGRCRFAHAVCATPLSTLRDLRFDPPLTGEKRALADAVPFSSAVRIALEMSWAFWRERGLNGFGLTDTLGEIWDPLHGGPSCPALLVCYAKGTLADDLCALRDEERVAHAVDELDRVFPGAARSFRKGTSHCWNHQPWIRGGWPLAREGFAHRVREFRVPEGRILFAGDHATEPPWLNTVEGALESGEHAADVIGLEGGARLTVAR